MGVGAGSPEQEPQMKMGPVWGSLLPSHPVVTQPALGPEQIQSKALEDKGRNHTRRESVRHKELLTGRPSGKVLSSGEQPIPLPGGRLATMAL